MATQPQEQPEEGRPVGQRPVDDLPTPTFLLGDFQRLAMGELVATAASLGIESAGEFDRQQLVLDIVAKSIAPTATGRAEGVLDIRPEGFGFLRSPSHQYRNGADDVYVSPNQIRRLRPQAGQWIRGVIRLPRAGENYFALVRVETIEGRVVAKNVRRVPFQYLTPVLPRTRLRLGHRGSPEVLRAIDLLAPLGLGQRVLLRTPPGSRRAELLRHIAEGVLGDRPDARVVLLLVDQKPEEQTATTNGLRGNPRAEVFASTFDEAPERHTELAALARARVARMVEAEKDVVLLVDSLTQLTRAYNASVPHSGKIISAGLDAHALRQPKELFGAARQTEEGPSLTVIATLLVGTGIGLNDAIAEEFRGKANATIAFDRGLIEQHAYPALDVEGTSTRWEDNLLDPEELEQSLRLRRQLAGASKAAALDELLAMIRNTGDNAELLARLRGL